MRADVCKQYDYLHQGFFDQAARQPQAIAVICGTDRLTYADLAQRARRVAKALIAAGCTAGEVVAVDALRSIETVAALFGILEAGGAYLPIDPQSPEGRVQFLLEDCGVRLAVAQPGSVVAAHVAQSVSSQTDACLCHFVAPPPARNARDALAYVIFTSGSSGTPKGVMINHAAAMNTIRDVNERFAVGERDRVFALSSFAFDLSVYDLFGVLAAGGTIVLPTETESRDPAAWGRLIRAEQATIWNSVPALMELLLSHLLASDQNIGGSLRLAMLSGDWISVSLPGRLWSVSPGTEVVSLGGATEASIWSIAYPIHEVDPAWTSIPYGKPLANQHFYILNAEGERCQAGQTGELYIGGAGVAVGYFNRPELNVERFVPDLWCDESGATMYRTGDFGRRDADDTIEFLGRIDNQLKVNGHRIELAEIESRLAQHADVGQCAVSAVGDSPETRRLVAHIVPRNGSINKRVVRAYLRKHLPPALVPSSLVAVASLPMNANGKIDRARLQMPKAAESSAANGMTDQLSGRIATIWRDVLHLPEVGLHESFFDLGGDSLAAALLFIRLEQEFENAPSLTALLEHPTIADLARLLEPARKRKKNLLVRLQPNGNRTPLFCVPGADGQLLIYRHLAQSIGVDQPVYGLQPRGLDGAEPDRSVEDCASRSVRELRRVQPNGPYRLAGFSTGGVVSFEMARQLHKMGERVSLLLMFDSFAGLPPGPSLLNRLNVQARHLVSLPWHDWPQHVGERSKVAWIKLCGLLRRTPPERRWTEGLKLTPNATRVALANLRAVQSYQPRPYPGTAILFRAAIQHRMRDVGDDLGWGSLCQSGLRVLQVPGTHADCLSPRHIDSLARTIRGLLEDVGT